MAGMGGFGLGGRLVRVVGRWLAPMSMAMAACSSGDGSRTPEPAVSSLTQALTGYVPPSAPAFTSFFTAGVVDSTLPSGELAGKLDGSSGITPDGAFSYVIPIAVPDGPGGLKPELTLAYNSRGEDGLVGVGWQVTGVSKITRCPKSLAVDELVERVLYDSTDRFCLDGAKLMGVGGTYGASGAEYRTERADYAKIVSYGSLLGGPEYFKVWAKDGLVREYRSPQNFVQNRYRADGSVESSREVTQLWNLVTSTDRAGNELTYSYDTATYLGSPVPDRRITKISYSGGQRAVVFDYELTTPLGGRHRFDGGVDFVQVERLKRIRVQAPNPSAVGDVWKYELEYGPSPSAASYRSRLQSVRRCDAKGVCLPSTLFSWESIQEPNGATPPQAFSPRFVRVWESSVLDFEEKRGWARPLLADFTGDGRDDLLYHVRDPRDVRLDFSCNGTDWRYAKAFLRVSNGIRSGVPVFGDPIDVSEVFQPPPGGPPGPFDPFKSRVADFDGDGALELFGFNAASWPQRFYKLFQWNSQASTLRVVSDGLFFFNYNYDRPIHVLDANGDGRADVMALGSFDPVNRWWLYPSAGALQLGTPVPLSTNSGGCVLNAGTLDLDGDGRVEVVHACETGDFAIGVDARGAAEEEANRGLTRERRFADVNGDGLQDGILIVANSLVGGTPGGVYVALNTGNGFLPRYRALEADWPAVHNPHDDVLRVADFNADGRDDILVLSRNPILQHTVCMTGKEVGSPRLLLSDGRNYHEIVNAFRDPNAEMRPRWHNEGAIPRGWSANQLGDVDGNGIPEVIQLEGTGAIDWRFRLYSYQSAVGAANAPTRPYRTAEEHIVQVADGYGEREAVSYADLAAPTDLVEPPGEFYKASDACRWPQHCLKRGLTVVRSHTKSNGRPALGPDTQRRWIYSYEDARTDVGGRGFLGFKCMTVLDEQRGSVEKTCSDNATRQNKACPGYIYPFAGLPKSVEVRAPLGDGTGRVRVSQTDYVWQQPRWMNHSVFSVELDRRIARVKEGVPTTQDLLGAVEVLSDAFVQRRVETKYTFDSNGNLMEELETRTAAGKTTISRTKTEFDNYTDDRWLIGLPKYQEVERQRTGEAAQKRVARISHNTTTGLLESITLEPDSGNDLWYKRSYIRGTRGVVDRIEEEALNQTKRATSFQYDSEWVSVRRIENAEGHVSWVGVHPALGVPLVTRDANGVTRSRKVDGFARLRFIDEPDAGDTTITYGRAAVAAPVPTGPETFVAYATRSTTAGGQDTIETFDSAGRSLGGAWRTFDGGFAHVKTTFDRLGRPNSRTLAHAVGGSPAGLAGFAYDLLDRPTKTANPDASFTLRTYPSFFESRVQDEEGGVTFVVSDVDALVERSGARDGTREIATRFTYWPFGNIHTVTDAFGNVTTTDYDVRGRRTKLVDPDAGVRKYSYNGFGEIREERHGAKPTDNENFLYLDAYLYDRLGRLTDKASSCLQFGQCRSEGTRRFVWDESQYGVGQIARSFVSGGNVQTDYKYDADGRPVTETLSVEGEVFALDTRYDLYGRVSNILYPETPGLGVGRFEVANHYTDFGYATNVENRSSVAYWTAVERTLEGAVTVESQYATGSPYTMYRHYEYDPLTRKVRRADSIASGPALNRVRQRQGYDFYLNGQVKTRREQLDFDVTATPPTPRVVDGYQYDYANRLARWTRTGDAPRAEVYATDDIGNITSVTHLTAAGATARVESYKYDRTNGAGPHAATSLGTTSYQYDKGGRQIARVKPSGLSELSLSYTAFDLPYQAIFEGSGEPGTTSFTYDSLEQRVVKNGPTGRTVYLGKLYEKRRVPAANGVPEHFEHAFYVQAEGQVVAQVIRNALTGQESSLFIHKDPLQTTTFTFNTQGGVTSYFYYSPWGQRSDSHGAETSGRTFPASYPVTRGFTGHEHDDELGLINMQGRLYDPRLRRFLSPDPLSEVPVRFPLECVISPCDEDQTNPDEGGYGVPLTRFGGDESSYSAETSSVQGSTAAHFGRRPRDADGMTLGVAELNLLSQRAGAAGASRPTMVGISHPDGLNRYAYAYNNPIRYRDPHGYAVETPWDLLNVALDLASLAHNVSEGKYGAAVVDAAALVVDVAATLAPGVPGGAGTALRVARGGEQAVQAIKSAEHAKNAVKTAENAANVADDAKKVGKAVSEGAAGKAATGAEGAGAKGQTGSYTNTHGSGKTYSGKGSRERSQKSGRRVEKTTQDKHVATEWKAAKDKKEAFKDEARRIHEQGGPKSPENYNKVESPGKKLLEGE